MERRTRRHVLRRPTADHSGARRNALLVGPQPYRSVARDRYRRHDLDQDHHPIAHDTQPPTQLIGQRRFVSALAFSPDGATLASGSDDHTVRLWAMSSHRTTAILQGHTVTVRAITFAADGTALASGGDDGTVILWDAKSHQAIGQPLQPDISGDGTVRSLAASPAGDSFVEAGKESLIWPFGAAAWRASACALAGRGLTTAEADRYLPEHKSIPMCA